MKIWLLVGYAILVFVGVVLLVRRNDPVPLPPLRAATSLNEGRLLSTGDLTLGGGPHYLRRAVPAGGAITADNLRVVPAVATAPGTVSAVVNLAPGQAALNAGDKGWLCSASATPPKSAGAATVKPATNTVVKTGESKTAALGADGTDTAVAVVSRICGGGSCLAVVAVPAERAPALFSTPRLVHSQPCR